MIALACVLHGIGLYAAWFYIVAPLLAGLVPDRLRRWIMDRR